jgi:hypothetical protein
MRARLSVLAALLAVSVATGAAAAGGTTDKASDDQSARLQMARDVIDACGEREQMAAYFDKAASEVVTQARQQTPDLSDAQWTTFGRIVSDDLNKQVDTYLELIATTYTQYLSVDDMRTMTEYCHSPVGRKVSSLRARMESETFEIREAWLRSTLIAALADAHARVHSGGSVL